MIRSAESEDCAVLADLILLSDSGLLPVLFPGGPRTTLTFLASRPRNPFSYKHALILQLRGRVVAAAVGSTAECLKEERLPTAALIARHYGLRAPARLLLLAKAGVATNTLSAGDFYLSNIAVFPRSQGRGHGTRLLRHLESGLRERGARRVVLDVDPRNEHAILFYSTLGYREERRITITLERQQSFEYRRLWKPLTENASTDQPPT